MGRIWIILALAVFVENVQAQDTIRIGAPLPITGALAIESSKQQRGYDLWAKLVNSSGGINVNGKYYKVDIVYLDYQSDNKKVRKVVETLVIQEKVHLLFAPYGSNAARRASPIAQLYKIPMIAVTASSKQVYSRGHEYIFGNFTPNETLTEPITDLVKQNLPQVTKIAILARKDLFPKSIARAINQSTQVNGINNVLYRNYPVDSTDHTDVLLELKASQPDWIFVSGYMFDLVKIRKEMAELEIKAPIVTMIAAPAYQEFIDSTGALAENITSAAWWHPAVQYAGEDVFGTTENFVKRFQEQYGSTPDYVEASAALAGALFQMAIERAGTTEGKMVRDELARMDEITFWGPVKFGANGQNDSLVPPVFQIQNGKPVIIYPKEIATGQLQVGIK